ncbi:MAG: HAD family hydrolase [Spirochaetaceae bacterium]
MALDHDTADAVGDQLPEDLQQLFRERMARAEEPVPGPVAPKLTPLPEIRGVLFDVYGTLVQSAAGEISLHAQDGRARPFYRLAEALPGTVSFDRVEALAARYYEKIAEVHAARRALGVRHPEVDIITVWHGLTEEFPELLGGGQEGQFPQARWLALRFELEANPVAPMPGSGEILRDLRRRGQLLGIVSNAQFYTPLLFPLLFGGTPEELGFAFSVWSYREGEAKPSERLYRNAADWFAKAYSVKPEELLMIGNDLRNDVAPAAAVGLKTALFAGDRRSLRLHHDEPEYRETEPDIVLTNLTQLHEVVL